MKTYIRPYQAFKDLSNGSIWLYLKTLTYLEDGNLEVKFMFVSENFSESRILGYYAVDDTLEAITND